MRHKLLFQKISLTKRLQSWLVLFLYGCPYLYGLFYFKNNDYLLLQVVDLGKFHLESETCTTIRKQMEELQKQRQQAAASSTSYYGYLPNFATTKSTTTKGSSVECKQTIY